MDYFELLDNLNDAAPGFKQVAYYAPIRDFDSIADLVDRDASTVDRVTITADHTFLAGKGFVKLYSTPEKTQLNVEQVGEPDNEIFKSVLQLFYPGDTKEGAAFASMVQNERRGGILLFETINGKIMQLGDATLGVKLRPKRQVDPVTGGVNGYTLDGDYYHTREQYYEGLITLKPVV